MATVTIGNSPVHQSTVLTGVYGQTGSSWKACGFHTGTDFARNGYSSLPEVYSVCTGVYVKNEFSSVLGQQVVIQDSSTGMYWRYCHLSQTYAIVPGTQINTGTALGVMGETGTGAHGVHLHLEYSTSQYWTCSAFQNPSAALGIPNISGTVVNYNGETPPVPPTPPTPGQDTPTGPFYHRLYNGKWFWSTAPGYTGELNNSSDLSKKQENADYIRNYLEDVGWTIESISVVVGAMDLVSTLNSAWKPTTDTESPFGLLGWRYWEFTDWVDDHGEWVSDSDYTIIDNSIGRICWYRQYDLAWNDVSMTLQQFSESHLNPKDLSYIWYVNYAYNNKTAQELEERSLYWYEYFMKSGNKWKWLYGKNTTYNLH